MVAIIADETSLRPLISSVVVSGGVPKSRPFGRGRPAAGPCQRRRLSAAVATLAELLLTTWLDSTRWPASHGVQPRSGAARAREQESALCQRPATPAVEAMAQAMPAQRARQAASDVRPGQARSPKTRKRTARTPLHDGASPRRPFAASRKGPDTKSRLLELRPKPGRALAPWARPRSGSSLRGPADLAPF